MSLPVPANLLSRLPAGVFPTFVTVQQFSASASSADESAPVYAAVTGLSNIRARIFNLSRQFGSDAVAQTDPDASHAVLLGGYYPTAEAGMVVIDNDSGEMYSILREVSDGNHTVTKLMCHRKP